MSLWEIMVLASCLIFFLVSVGLLGRYVRNAEPEDNPVEVDDDAFAEALVEQARLDTLGG